MKNSFTVAVQKDSRIFIPLAIENPASGKTFSVNALVDTGASISCIKKNIAENILGLKELRKDTVISGYNTERDKSIYNVNLMLPTKTYCHDILAAEFSNEDNIDFILGMNVILQGDFAVTSVDGIKIFSICFPSRNQPIDFRFM